MKGNSMIPTEDMTDSKNGLFHKGDVIALLRPDGKKVTQAIRSVDDLMTQLTRDELKQLHERLTREALMDPDTDPQDRHEILSRMDVCPCCQRWLGHNNPPSDADESEPPLRRQRAFDFDGK
jgi:hypothetical protein